MFDHKHYVPILKTKAGERWSLEHLKASSLPHITPVLEIHPPRTPRKNKNKPNEPPRLPKTVTEHVSEVFEAIASIWPTGKDFFLDAHWLVPTARTIKTVFECARTNGLNAIPVALPGYGAAVLSEISGIAQKDGRGCLLRCKPSEIASPLFQFGIERINLPSNLTDILIDYGDSPMASLGKDIISIPSLKSWRTLTAASGVFPPSLKGWPQKKWFVLNRSDWTSWENEIVSGKLARKPSFSDYGTRDPQPPSEFGDPDVHLRYTKDRVWNVYQDGKHKAGGAENIFHICAQLVSQPFFDGAELSAGDTAIAECALRSENPGGPAQWTQWCLSHHIEFVIRQMSSHASL